MTNMNQARRAVRLYSNPLVSKATNRFNQRSWLRSVRMLGDRWHLANNQPLVRLVRLSTTPNWRAK